MRRPTVTSGREATSTFLTCMRDNLKQKLYRFLYRFPTEVPFFSVLVIHFPQLFQQFAAFRNGMVLQLPPPPRLSSMIASYLVV